MDGDGKIEQAVARWRVPADASETEQLDAALAQIRLLEQQVASQAADLAELRSAGSVRAETASPERFVSPRAAAGVEQQIDEELKAAAAAAAAAAANGDDRFGSDLPDGGSPLREDAA
eukprot:SAG22_NODE_219_length_14877_cov_14.334619_15_plen_118_part_00